MNVVIGVMDLFIGPLMKLPTRIGEKSVIFLNRFLYTAERLQAIS